MEDPTATEPAIITIQELIDRMALEQGDTPFLISPETERALTFGDLRDEARAVSGMLLQAGLEPGDKAAFLMDNGLFTAQLFLGTMYGGLVSVPLNVRAGVSQLAYTLDHCDAKVVFVEDQYAALAQDALASVSRSVRVIPAEVDAFARECGGSATAAPLGVPAPEDIALLMYTSGSVGQPKAAIHSHRTVLAHGFNSKRSHELTPDDRSLLVLPIYHINAECVTLMPTLFSGGSIVVPHHFNVSQFWDLLDRYQCTWSAVVPTIISQLLDWKDAKATERDATFRRIRFIRSSSAPLSPSLQREFMEKFPIRLIQAMGSSEAGNIFANPQAPGANKIGTPGPAWGFETRIVSPEGADVPPGEPGEVLLRGVAVTRGYYKDAEQTAAVFDENGWLHTGDLAYQDQDGYFFVVGRSKELIIKGGMNIAPRQVDEVLESHPAVLEAAVVGVPDHYLGEDLIAFAVLRSGAVADEKAMLAFCESRLGHFKTPARIHFVADLPKGPSGKIQRLHLLDQAAQLAGTAPSFNDGHKASAESAAGTIGETITQSWAEVLELQEVDAQTNFFSLGGHSLMAIQCLSRLREKLPIALSLADFFEHPTIAEQVSLVKQRLDTDRYLKRQGHAYSTEDTESQPIPLRENHSTHPLSSGQRRLWFFEELAPDVPLYNESETVRLVGELHPDAMEQAFNLIVSRHEILRTTLKMAEEGPVAVVHENWPQQIKRIDLSDLAPASREAQVERLLIEEPRRPYHLDRSPGIRATLIRLAPAEHIFILMIHHQMGDWSSEGVFWRELSTAYRAIVRGDQPELPDLTIQYGDYAAWQQRRVAEGAFTKDLDFWEENLRGAPELLELPSDRPRPGMQTYRGARQRFRLSAALTEALRNCSREEKSSLFTIFAAALQTLLYRYTGTEDILLGIPLAEREHKELQNLMGFLLHTQVLRTRLSGDMTFRELIALVRKASVDLYTHREVPFEEVVSKIRPERSLSHSPIFQVMINWRDQDQHLSYVGLDGLVVESLLSETRTSKFDLALQLTDFGSEVWLEVEYSTDLFDDDRIARMAAHYRTILEAVVANPGEKLAALSLLTEAERRQLLIEWNTTEVPFPAETCVYELFEAQVERTPDAIAVEAGQQSLTYRELNYRSNQLARHLRKMGVKSNDLIGICVDRSLEMVVGLLGILKAGAAYLPLDSTYPADRLAFMLRDSGAVLLLTQGEVPDGLAVPGGILALDRDWPRIQSEDGSNLAFGASASDCAYVIYTSGSTGQPKGVQIVHRAVVNLLCALQKKLHLQASDTLLAVATLSFDMAVVDMFFPLAAGARIVIASRETTADGEALLRSLLSSNTTILQATPITYRMLIEAGWSSRDRRVKAICGGESLTRELADQILERVVELWNFYGPTETTVLCSGTQLLPGQPITIGRPIDNMRVVIMDGSLQLAPIGISGEIHLAGIGVSQGYLNRPELTAEKFIASPLNPGERLYKTGDLARYLPNGNIEFLGRVDHQVKVRGFRMELGEIEASLRVDPSVAQCVVEVGEDRAGDKLLLAYVVPSNGALDTTELREFLKRKLPHYMIPAAFIPLDRLPLTLNGKVDRKALPAPQSVSARSATDYVAPRTTVEESIAGIWRRVLGLEQIGVHDDFFALGGHSLQAARVIVKIQKSLNYRLSVPAFFQNPTIAAIAKLAHGELASGHELIPLKIGNEPGTIFFINAEVGLCRLAKSLKAGLSSFATVVPLPPSTLRAAALNQPAGLPSVEAMAAEQVALIRTRLDSGPCILVGHSFNGTLAFEAAHQLQREGISVEMILLLDAWSRSPAWQERISAMSLNRAKRSVLFRASRLRAILRARLLDLRAHIPRAAGSPSTSSAADGMMASADELPPNIFSWVHGWMLPRVRKDYRYLPLDSRAILFHCQGDSYNASGMGWEGLFTRGLHIVKTSGDHFSLIAQPHIGELARKIDKCLGRLEHGQKNEPRLSARIAALSETAHPEAERMRA